MSATAWIIVVFVYLAGGAVAVGWNLSPGDARRDGWSYVIFAVTALLLLWPFVLGWVYIIVPRRGNRLEKALSHQPEQELQALASEQLRPSLPDSWIQSDRVSLATLRAEAEERARRVGERDVYQVALERFVSAVQPGDEIREFRSPPDSWAQRAGRAGVVHLRDGKVLAKLIRLMN